MIGILVRDSLNRKKEILKQSKRIIGKLNEIGLNKIDDVYTVYSNYDNLISDLKNEIVKVVFVESEDSLSRDIMEIQKRRIEISKYSQLFAINSSN